MRIIASTLLSILFCVSTIVCSAERDSSAIYKRRKILLGSGATLFTAGSLAALNQAWYSQYNTGKFHLFNDNEEWLQMDKAGHIYSTYQTSRLLMEAFQWAHFSRKKQLLIGGGLGLAYMTAIEIMDGFSRGWGFSWGDQLCDLIGSGGAVAQEVYWREQRFQMKFSYAESGLAKYNPNLLGDSYSSRLLKDYNGQTYWLSFNPFSFGEKKCKLFPVWLNLSFGYSAYGMLGGHYNRLVAQDKDGNVYQVDRQRRYYLSLDLDLTKIPAKQKWLKAVFSVVNMLKVPAPALEFSGKGLRAYGIYY